MRILAFSVAHDSSVACIDNGNLEFFCKEERLTDIKRDQVPFKALELFRLKNNKNIDHILYCTPSNSQKDVEGILSIYIEKVFNKQLENFSELKHHDCHMALSYVNSGFDEALVFVVDRNGSSFYIDGHDVARECESVYAVSKNNIKNLQKNFFITGPTHQKHIIKNHIQNSYDCEINCDSEYSIVKVYEAATTLIGQHPLENGKTMGLSAYSNKQKFENLFYDNLPISEKFTGYIGNNLGVTFSDSVDKITDNVNKQNYTVYADKAKQVQEQTQSEMLKLIKKHVNATGIKNVCLVGGYGLNVVANNFYIKNLPEVNFYFEPTADDTGISLGASMLKYYECTNKWPKKLKDNFYHYYENTIENKGKTTSIKDISNLLKNKKSIAIFEGSPEAGPRALGHRSILFDPRESTTKDIVNKIKRREWYRPFAGIILQEKFTEYFETLGIESSEYMTINFAAKENAKKIAPGIIHIDGTCRIQTVKEGFLYELLTQFYKDTGCPMLLNTSFNLAGKPLIHTKTQAMDMLNTSELDHLYFVDERKIL
jgi:carbamoyltransferase